MAQTIQVRRGTAAAWTAANPVLAAGEHGFEYNTGKEKIGDGATAWNSLGYAGGPGVLSQFAPVASTWAALTAYKAGQLISHSGSLYTADANFTSPASFNTTGLTSVGGGGGANLAYTTGTTNGVVTSDTGTDATITAADGTNAGLMLPAGFTKLAGIETGATADQTAAEILTAIKTVDGAASGLDADLLDGVEAAGFATAAQGTTADAAVPKSLYDANTILYATTDNTPAALTVGASTFVGRKASGNISAMSTTEATALIDAASATAAGKVELATDAETITGTDTVRATTPANVAAKLADYKTNTLDAAYPPLTQSVNAQVGTTYTFVLTDNGKLVTATNGSATAYTVPTNASVAFPTGALVTVANRGAGLVTVSAISGVTFEPSGLAGAIALETGAVATFQYLGSDVWSVSGGDPAGALLASNIAFSPSGTVQSAIDDHIGDTTAAHAASAIGFTPTGTIAATNVQAAIAEVASEATGATNLAYTAAVGNGVVTSDTGTDATITAADGTNAGLMLPAGFTKLAGIETGATADQTAAEILTAIKTVDGAASGLDADLLDGVEAAGFATAAQGTTADAAVPKSLYDANTILYATTDNTPAALTVGASTFVGRKASGNISAMSTTEATALIDAASATAAGKVELATDAETITGTDTVRAVTPANVKAAYQPLDADLTAIAALASAANKMPYSTAAQTWALADFSAAGRALVDDADAATQRTTLGLGTIATQASSSVTITGGSITGITDLTVADGGTGASTAAAARTNLDAAQELWRCEVNAMAETAKTGTWAAQAVNTWMLAAQVSDGAQNNTVDYTVDLSAGTWSLNLFAIQGAAQGIVTVRLDGTLVGTIDLYSAAADAAVRKALTGFTVTVDGKQTLRLDMATKNASASAYQAIVSWVTLWRTA